METILSVLQIEPSALRPVFHFCASLYFADRILGKISRGFFSLGCYLLLPLFLLPIGCVGYRTRIYHVHSEIQCLTANKLYQLWERERDKVFCLQIMSSKKNLFHLHLSSYSRDRRPKDSPSTRELRIYSQSPPPLSVQAIMLLINSV